MRSGFLTLANAKVALRPFTPRSLTWIGAVVVSLVLAAPASAANVDLILSADEPIIAPGNSGTQTFTIKNFGQAGTSNIIFKYTSPVFVNFGPQASQPAGCTVVYSNPDRFVPESLQCTVAALGANASTTLAIVLAVPADVSGQPPTPLTTSWSLASVFPDPAGSDTDSDPTDNIAMPGVDLDGTKAGAIDSTKAALFLEPATGVVYTDGTDGALNFLVGNDKTAGGTNNGFRLVFTLPPFVTFKSSDANTTCSTLYPPSTNTDLTVQQIISCTNPGTFPVCTLLNVLGVCVFRDPTATIGVTITVTGHPGAPPGGASTSGVVSTTGSDVDQNLVTNLFGPNLQIPH